MGNTQYWATAPTEEIGQECMRKIEEYGEYLETSGVMSELRRSYEKYYGTTSVKTTGVQGELSAMRVNHYASLIRSVHSMVTANRPAWEPRATNTDVKSQAQCVLAAGLLDYYAREKRMERHLDTALLTALFLREAWVSTTWDPNAGEIYSTDPDSQVPVMEGDLNYRVYRLNDVIRDINCEDSQHDWLIVRDFVNKFDEAAKFPDLAERLVGLTVDRGQMEQFRIRPLWTKEDDSDLIPKYTLYIRKCAALPNGRMVTFYSGDIVTFDGSLPFRRVPLRQISSEEMLETAFGHSPMFDLMPLQEAIDTIFSTILTNQKTFGVQNIAVPKGSAISVAQIAGGLNLLEYDHKMGPPQALNLTQTPKEIFEYANMLVSAQETLSGQNAVARGNASPQLSGAAMALLQSTALQMSSGIQKTHIRLVEDVGTDTIHTLSDFASTKRVAYIVGKHNRSMIREYSGDDVNAISRVTVDSANALTKTTAGRAEIANQLLQAGLIKRPEQYLTVIQTGRLEPMYENETSELMLIRSENEDLAEGKSAVAVATDSHAMHILEHKSVLASPEARQDANIVQATLAHIQEHITLLQTVDPTLLQLIGQQPAAPMAPQGVPDAMNAEPQMEQAGSSIQPAEPAEAPMDPLTGQPLTQTA